MRRTRLMSGITPCCIRCGGTEGAMLAEKAGTILRVSGTGIRPRHVHTNEAACASHLLSEVDRLHAALIAIIGSPAGAEQIARDALRLT